MVRTLQVYARKIAKKQNESLRIAKIAEISSAQRQQERIDYKAQAEAYVAALERAKKREKLLAKLGRWKTWLGIRKSIGLWVFVGIVIFVWHRIKSGEWFGPASYGAIAFICANILARQFIPNQKAVDALEDAIEKYIRNGFL